MKTERSDSLDVGKSGKGKKKHPCESAFALLFMRVAGLGYHHPYFCKRNRATVIASDAEAHGTPFRWSFPNGRARIGPWACRGSSHFMVWFTLTNIAISSINPPWSDLSDDSFSRSSFFFMCTRACVWWADVSLAVQCRHRKQEIESTVATRRGGSFKLSTSLTDAGGPLRRHFSRKRRLPTSRHDGETVRFVSLTDVCCAPGRTGWRRLVNVSSSASNADVKKIRGKCLSPSQA